MALVAPVNLTYNVRTLWFDPNGIDVSAGDKVVVETARGNELGVCASDVIEVSEDRIEELKSPLKPVLRVATEEDLEQAERMDQLSREAMPVFRELARETSEDMHPVAVEYMLDGDKAAFYFESEARIDFRELVRKLAARFHIRVDMRQIGVRDEARIVGGIAHCGQEVCCKRLGGEFNPVSIRMAKDQDLSLNPQKISGLCGRLMCCLRYENEAYRDFKARAPKLKADISTPDGVGKVVELDVPRENVMVSVDEEKPVKVPLSSFEPAAEGERPNSIDREMWDEAKGSGDFIFETSVNFETSKFTGVDRLASAGQINRVKPERSQSSGALGSSATEHRKLRRRGAQKSQDTAPKPDAFRRSRRRSTTISDTGEVVHSNTGAEISQSKTPSKKKPDGRKQQSNVENKLRPGHKSSSLSHSNKDKQEKKSEDVSSAHSHRRRRNRRSRKSSNEQKSSNNEG